MPEKSTLHCNNHFGTGFPGIWSTTFSQSTRIDQLSKAYGSHLLSCSNKGQLNRLLTQHIQQDKSTVGFERTTPRTGDTWSNVRNARNALYYTTQDKSTVWFERTTSWAPRTGDTWSNVSYGSESKLHYIIRSESKHNYYIIITLHRTSDKSTVGFERTKTERLARETLIKRKKCEVMDLTVEIIILYRTSRLSDLIWENDKLSASHGRSHGRHLIKRKKCELMDLTVEILIWQPRTGDTWSKVIIITYSGCLMKLQCQRQQEVSRSHVPENTQQHYLLVKDGMD